MYTIFSMKKIYPKTFPRNINVWKVFAVENAVRGTRCGTCPWKALSKKNLHIVEDVRGRPPRNMLSRGQTP